MPKKPRAAARAAKKPAPTRRVPWIIAATLAVAAVSMLWLRTRPVPRPATPTPLVRNASRKPTVTFRLPPIHKLPEKPEDGSDDERLEAVREAFELSWSAYERNAWGKDEYHPLSRTGTNLLLRDDSPLGFTIVDALDSLILMGFKDEYERARDWIRDTLRWDIDGRLNVFETTIRVMGGLLSASELMRSPPPDTLPASEVDAQLFLGRARELAERLLPAFDSPTGIPLREINLATGEAFYDTDSRNASSLAEATTIQLEFKALAHLTQNETFWDVAERPMRYAYRQSQPPGMGILPIFVDVKSGDFYASEIRLGSRGDSYYEYLVKQYLQTNRTEHIYRRMFEGAFDSIKEHLLAASPFESPPIVHTLELFPHSSPSTGVNWMRRTKQDHLVCFLGGTMMLGASVDSPGPLLPPRSAYGSLPAQREDWRVGHELTRGCVDTYTSSNTGLGAEIVFFRTARDIFGGTRTWQVKRANRALLPHAPPIIDSRNILRPETVESLFIAFQLTGDPLYREWGWKIFEAFRRWCQVDGGRGGYAGIEDIDDTEPVQIDRMETFWLSETLKYLYLLFSPRNKLPFHEWVFNTEAHPLPVFTPTFATHIY